MMKIIAYFRKYLSSSLVVVAFLFAMGLSLPVHAATMYTTDTVNMRSETSRSATILFVLGPGTAVEANCFDGEWVDVDYKGKNGYICSQYLTYDKKAAKASRSTQAPQETAPQTSAAQTTAPVQSQSGQSSIDLASLGIGKPHPTVEGFASVKADKVNLRESPNGTIIAQLNTGLRVAMLDVGKNWTRIRVTDGIEGYIHNDFLVDKLSRKEQVNIWRAIAVAYCKLRLGQPYSQEKRDEEGYHDCSSLMRDAYFNVTGVNIGEYSVEQCNKMTNYFYKLDNIYDVAVGDIVYHVSEEGENHCGIYLGDGQVLNASQTVGCVKITSYDSKSKYWEYGCRAGYFCYDQRFF